VLLASLLAGGVGIDLTAASVVIHYDRWWNPAKEDQATDRVHRMGQRRFVQVVKLVTRSTIEERIDELIRAKVALFEQVVAPTEDLLRGLSREELARLLDLRL
jgi:SNF2 family DNA or RNA helicase